MALATFDPIEDGDNAGEAFAKINKALVRTDLTNTTHVLTKNRFGRWKTITLTNATTFQITMELESHYNQLRIGIPNLSAAAVENVKVSMSVFDAWINPHYYSHPYPLESWRPMLLNGSTTWTLPARFDEEIPSVTISDLKGWPSKQRTDVVGGRPIITIRVQYPAGAVVTVPYNDFYGWRIEPSGAAMRVSKQEVLGVDVPLNYTNTTSIDTGAVIPIVQYMSKKAGRQVLAVGDSTTEGVGPNTRCFGAVARAANTLSTLDAPFEVYNAGLHAQGQRKYIQMAQLMLNVIKPTHLVYQPYTVNDTPAGGMNANTYDAMWEGTGKILEYVRNSQIPTHLIFLEGLPCNPPFRNTGAGDQKRRDLNASLHAEYSGLVVVEGYAAAITGERNTDGQDLIAGGLTSDNVHPNEAGSDALAAVLVPVLESL